MATENPIPSAPRERELFLAALEQVPGERAAFLQAECGNDSALRQRIEELLREEEDLGDFLQTPAAPGTAPGAAAPATVLVTEKPGDRIGRYKLLQNIGEGGCGVVYMADQEEPVRRRVALKIIKLGMDTKSVIARFEAERQALAMMDHPNIAKVLDAGATDTGRPFFVMELVRGVRITEYCDEHNVPTSERLQLFIQVCQAIQHAHQKGIIHRDIKPSNILVALHDGVPVPKVIDFGIAKATEQRLTDRTLFTEFNSFIGTPAYMSPEQAEMSGLDIDTRSDIYSLGVLLYELLTGKTPFDAEALIRSGLDECRRTIRHEEPVRPSTRLATMVAADLTTTAQQRQTEAPRLIHLLRGDLDWIVMKCLEKDRTRRYDTAHDVALDVQRYLADEPVLARPPSNVYRLRKVFHRHRGAFAGAAAMAVTLIAGITISTWQAVRATRAEHRAQAAQHQETQLRRHAERAHATARINEYVADINLAQQSLVADNLGRAVQLLNKHRPHNGLADLRGFEWRYLWQLCQGDEHETFPLQDGPVQSLNYSPDGALLAIVARDQLAIWNVRMKSLVTRLPRSSGVAPAQGPGGPGPRPRGFPFPGITSAAFLPDGKTLVTASPANVRLWNTADWTERKTLRDCSGPIAVSADGARLAVMKGGFMNSKGVVLWDTARWQEVQSLPRASGPMFFSPDGKTLATDSEAGLTLWRLDGGDDGLVLESSTNLFLRGPFFREHILGFSPDSRWIVAARNKLSERGVFVLSIWDANTGKEIAVLPRIPEHAEHTGVISAVGFSPDGSKLATASMDYSIRLWDLARRERVMTLHGHLSEVWAATFSPDGTTIASGAKDGTVKLWPAEQEQKDDILPGNWQPLAFSTDARRLAIFNRAGRIGFLNVNTRAAESEFQLDATRFRFPGALSISGDLETIAQALDDGSVKVWRLDTLESEVLKASGRGIDLVVLSPDAQTLVTGGRFHTLRCWDLGSRTNVALSTNAHRAVFSPDGHTLASLARDNTVELWDVATRALRTRITVDAQVGPDAAFSHDGQTLAVICADDVVRLFDVAGGKFLGSCTGHKQGVFTVAFSPDGKTLATGSDDSTLKLWNVATQQEVLTFRRLGGAARNLLFSPDGSLLVAGTSSFSGSDGLRFYSAPLPEEAEGKDGDLALR